MDIRALLAHPAVRRARTLAGELEEETVEEQLRIVTIPAPSLEERRRAEYLARRFRDLRLDAVHLDEVGNCLGRLGPETSSGAPPVILSAHLDTVFGSDVVLTPRHLGNRILAPGITDNARGVAALLTTARALREAGLRTVRPIWFAGTVGEEGSGDLLGTKHLFRDGGPLSRPAAFIALDGSGIRRIVHRAIGARRLRVSFRGPGGHSWSDWGSPNPLHALGRAIERLLRIDLPVAPLATLTVARASGGTSINTIPACAWMELDLRSESQEGIAGVEAECRALLAGVVEEENRRRRRNSGSIKLQVDVIGDRPSGCVPESTPLVAAAVAATRIVGSRPELVASSTDANVPIARGIPAVTLGAGGESGGIHTVEEWFCSRDGAKGVERAILTALAVAGVA